LNQLLEHFMKNQAELHRYARKMTKNEEQAWDVIQKTYLYLLENPKENITHLKSYVYGAVTGRVLNHFRSEKIYSDYVEKYCSQIMDHTVASAEESYDHKETLNKVLDIVDTICSNKERQAVYHILSTDDQVVGINGGSFETLKSNRKWAIKRVKRYLDENSTNF